MRYHDHASSGWPVTQKRHRFRHTGTPRLLSSTICIYVFPNPHSPGFCLPEADHKFIATVPTKTFCIRLNAPTALLQASLYVTRQLQHKSLFLEYNGSQRKKVENSTEQFGRKCATTRLPVMSVQTILKLPGKLSRCGLQGCQHCQLQTFKKIMNQTS